MTFVSLCSSGGLFCDDTCLSVFVGRIICDYTCLSMFIGKIDYTCLSVFAGRIICNYTCLSMFFRPVFIIVDIRIFWDIPAAALLLFIHTSSAGIILTLHKLIFTNLGLNTHRLTTNYFKNLPFKKKSKISR